MNAWVMISVVEFKLLFRNFYSVFFAFAFPVGMLLLFGSIYGNEPVESFGGFGTIDLTAPAYMCMVIAVTGLMSLPLTVAQYRERKILKRFMASPINPSRILTAQVIVNLIMTVMGMAALLIVGALVFRLQVYGSFWPILFSLFLITISMFSIGLVIAGVSSNGRMATVLSYLIYFPMLFLSGATIPIEIMPDHVSHFAKVLPLTHGVELLKRVWTGGALADSFQNILVLSGVFLVCALLSVKAFRWE